MRRTLPIVALAFCAAVARTACDDGSRGALLAIGDTKDDARGLPDLPGARREVQAIAGLFPAARVIVKDDACKARLAEWNESGRLRKFRFIHFATHGVAESRDPGESAIVLSSRGGHPDDRLLTARDIAGSWRLDADLVVLSACRSAGRLGAGGSSALADAFIAAGARSVVVALWDVDDGAAALLMPRFYRLLLGGLAKDRALADAKAWLRNLTAAELAGMPGRPAARGRPRRGATDETDLAGDRRGDELPFSHPSFWAGFVLVGARE